MRILNWKSELLYTLQAEDVSNCFFTGPNTLILMDLDGIRAFSLISQTSINHILHFRTCFQSRIVTNVVLMSVLRSWVGECECDLSVVALVGRFLGKGAVSNTCKVSHISETEQMHIIDVCYLDDWTGWSVI